MAYIKFGSDLKKFKQRVYYWQQVPAIGAGQDENAYDPSNSSCTTLDYSQTPFRWENITIVAENFLSFKFDSRIIIINYKKNIPVIFTFLSFFFK